MKRLVWLLVALVPACGASDESPDAGIVTVGSAGGSQNEGEAGSDGDGNGDGGSASDGAGTGEPPPEEEEEADFRVPRASGRFVYSASEVTDSVAVIDSSNLGIDVVGVGRGPTVVVPIIPPDGRVGGVAVLDQASNDVALLTTTDAAQSSVRIVDVTPGANNLAVTGDGRFVFAYHDVDGPEALGPGSDQELTVIDTTNDLVSPMTVGAHPRAIEFDDAGRTAYVVTADGVNVVDLSTAMLDGKPDIVRVHVDDGLDPSLLEVQVAPNHGIALARVDGDARLVITDLVTRAQDVVELARIPTDLDISEDQSFAVLMLPTTEGSHFVEITLPPGATPEVRMHPVSGEYVGLAHLAPEGDTMVLYTTQNPPGAEPDPPGGGDTDSTSGPSDTDTDTATGTDTDAGMGSSSTTTAAGGESSSGGEPEPDDSDPVDPDADPRLRTTIARRNGGGWDTSITLFVDRPVHAVGIAPDGANGVLVHDQVEASIPFAYTLLDLAKEYPIKKLQTVEVEPGPILFTPAGDRAVVLLTDGGGVRRADQVDLRTFIVQSLGLGSPPRGAGYVEATDKVFVSQEHPIGRITFIDALGSIQTVTGFALGDAVKD